MPDLELNNISAAYGDARVLDNLDLTVADGSFVSLLGESGCGKTTTLRVVAGFLRPAAGTVRLGGTDYTHLPPNRRGFGYVFQSYALFPHLSVAANVAFGLRQRRVARPEITRRVDEMLEIVDLTAFRDRLIGALSGGQKQRVALARALVIRPDLLLFDEPLSNLDAKLRVQMRVEIRRLQQEFGITTLYVTHDQEECFSISDFVTIMNRGVIEQLDTPERIYRRPASRFVAKFVGFENFLELQRAPDADGAPVLTAVDGTTFRRPPGEVVDGDLGFLGAVRPDGISITGAECGGGIGGEVAFRTYLGRGYQYIVQTDIGQMTVNGEVAQRYAVGDRVRLSIAAEDMVVLRQ